jgi:hypothetical protein
MCEAPLGTPMMHLHFCAGGDAPNNVAQQTQQCIQQFYGTPVGKAVQAESVPSLFSAWNPNASQNLELWAEAIIGKGGGTFGAGIYTGTEEISTLSGVTNVASTAELGAHALLGALGKLATAATALGTGLDVMAHAGCGTVARQNAGQMTPLPPGATVSF